MTVLSSAGSSAAGDWDGGLETGKGVASIDDAGIPNISDSAAGVREARRFAAMLRAR